MGHIKRHFSTQTLCIVSVSLLLGISGCAGTNFTQSAPAVQPTTTADSPLLDRVHTAIKEAPVTRPFGIAVDASDSGEVELSGFVDTQEQIDEIGTLVENVGGVTSVTNSIQLKPAS